jgi:hypothetical protein
VGEQGRSEILVVEVFCLISDADFDDAVLIVAVASEAVGEVEFVFVEFDAMTGVIVEVLEFRFCAEVVLLVLQVFLSKIVSGYPFIPLVNNLAQNLVQNLYSVVGLCRFAAGLNHPFELAT